MWLLCIHSCIAAQRIASRRVLLSICLLYSLFIYLTALHLHSFLFTVDINFYLLYLILKVLEKEYTRAEFTTASGLV